MKNGLINPEPCILVVDDHEISRQHTVQVLSAITTHVSQAGSGMQAMEFASRLLPDIIFLDIHLPDMCGLSLPGRIREAWPPDRPHPEFVVLSGDNSASARHEAGLSEVSAFLSKPVSFDQIQGITTGLCHPEHVVRECSTRQFPRPALIELFVEELLAGLPTLDRDIYSLNWASAIGLLHQLIASCAMCRERNLESHCRQLHKALSRKSPARKIAAAYYSLLKSADHMRMLRQDR